MGFVDQWISWNLECIKSVKFCVNLNGKLLDKFTPSRGIRRGDPLSPYLFLFVGESLSALLRQQIAARNFQELKITRKSPGISHLLFTDDSLLFFQANPDQATVINDVLRNYEKGTGQLLSPAKCSLMLGQHCPADDGNRVVEVLKVETMTMDEKYLGIPIPEGCIKEGKLKSSKDKLSKKCSDWNEKYMSTVAKEDLINRSRKASLTML
jgi:hypothetical protein